MTQVNAPFVTLLSQWVLPPHLHRAPQRGELLLLCCMAGGLEFAVRVKAAPPLMLKSVTVSIYGAVIM